MRNYIIPALALLCIVGLLMHSPIPQDQDYHHFADQRPLFGIPNFLNVITNLPFLIVGVMGLRVAKRIREKEVKTIFITLFTGFILVSIGSGYYHLWPNNFTLVFDRLPITVVLMSFFAFLIYEHIDKTSGYKLFIILNIVGLLSVIYWMVTERSGIGDLRWYGIVQFFPVIAIPLILLLYGASHERWKEVVIIFIFFGLAKFTERFDKEVFQALNNTISGHSLKHLFMIGAEYEIVVLLGRRINTTG